MTTWNHRLAPCVFSVAAILALGACPADDAPADSDESSGTAATDAPMTSTMTDPTTTGMTMSTTDPSMSTTEPSSDTDPLETSGGPEECRGVGGPGAEGDPCTGNGDCASGVCALFQDVPADDDAVCGAEMPDCSTRATGTLYSLTALVENGSAETVAGVDVNVVKALDAITNPAGAMPVASGTSDANGEIDATSVGPIVAPIAIIAVAGGGDFFLTATGVSGEGDGGYTVGTDIHEFWVVETATVSAWSDELAMDTTIEADLLPLGAAGGVVGFVRDGEGNPVADATVVADADGSGALIRFPQDDGTMGTDMTGPSGTFVILGANQVGEDFNAAAAGATGSGQAGTANNVVFSLIITIE